MTALAHKLRQLRACVDRVNSLAVEVVHLSGATEVMGYVPTEILRIQRGVCTAFSLPLSAMQSRDKHQRVAEARQLAMWISRHTTKYALQAIGAAFCRDHGTIIHALHAIEKRRETEPSFRAQSDALLNSFKTERTVAIRAVPPAPIHTEAKL